MVLVVVEVVEVTVRNVCDEKWGFAPSFSGDYQALHSSGLGVHEDKNNIHHRRPSDVHEGPL